MTSRCVWMQVSRMTFPPAITEDPSHVSKQPVRYQDVPFHPETPLELQDCVLLQVIQALDQSAGKLWILIGQKVLNAAAGLYQYAAADGLAFPR